MTAPARSQHQRTLDYRDKFRRVKPLSPRMRNAVRLYSTGIAGTKYEAAKMAGLHPGTFYVVTSPAVADGQVNRLMTQTDQLVQDETIDTRRLLDILGRKAIGKIANLMNSAAKEEVQLKAAVDLADRGSDTSKIQKHQVESFTLRGADVAALTEAMVAAAESQRDFGPHVMGDFKRLESADAKGRGEGLIEVTCSDEVDANAKQDDRLGQEPNASDEVGKGATEVGQVLS
jgi:hypothetical protein